VGKASTTPNSTTKTIAGQRSRRIWVRSVDAEKGGGRKEITEASGKNAFLSLKIWLKRNASE